MQPKFSLGFVHNFPGLSLPVESVPSSDRLHSFFQRNWQQLLALVDHRPPRSHVIEQDLSHILFQRQLLPPDKVVDLLWSESVVDVLVNLDEQLLNEVHGNFLNLRFL